MSFRKCWKSPEDPELNASQPGPTAAAGHRQGLVRRPCYNERVTPEWGKSRSQLWELKRGLQKERSRLNSAQARGHRLEPVARALYEQRMGWSALPVCGTHDEHDWMKVSLDGWNPDKRIATEIKAPNRDDHQEALDGLVPAKYKWQVLHQALVAGAKVIHYVSYSDYFPPALSFTLVQVYPDQKMLAELLTEEKRFWEAVVEGRPVLD